MSFGYVPPQTQRRLSRRAGSSRFVFWAEFSVGFFGGAFLFIVLGLGLNEIFPPSRLNVLVIGLDRRPAESLAARSDTLILATLDPATHYVGLLSIPRDLWVRLPDGSENRINTAFFFAELQAPGSGPQAALQVVSSNFGLTLRRYVRVDFEGFVQIIDSLGGIDVVVPHPIFDDGYPAAEGGVQTISFEVGPQHLDGERALQYARSRHSSSDFDRAGRQQEIVRALWRRLLQPAVWPRLPALGLALQSSLDTNLTPVELVRLLPSLVSLGPDAVDHRVIQGDMVQPSISSGGAAVQLPVWPNINPVLAKMFGE